MAGNIGLRFDPYRTLGMQSDNQSVPTIVDEYSSPSVVLPFQWNPKRFNQAKGFVDWAVETPVEEQTDVFNVMSGINKWNAGYAGLDDKDKMAWDSFNPKYAGRTEQQKDRIWRNQQYINQFGLEDFQNHSKEERDEKYEDFLTSQAILGKYGNDGNINELLNLTPEGKKELLASDYKSNFDLKQEEDKNPKKKGVNLFLPDTWEEGNSNWWDYSLKERATSLLENTKTGALEWASSGSVLGGAIGGGVGLGIGIIAGAAGGALSGMVQGLLHPEDSNEVLASSNRKDNAEILHKISVADNNRKKDSVSVEAGDRFLKLYQAYTSGQITEDEINKRFDEVALNGKSTHKDELGNTVEENNIGSNYYSAFKDSGEFEHFGPTEKLKYLAQTEAIANKYGMNSAIQVLDQDMQDYVNRNQSSWLWAGQTGMNIAVGGTANLANNVVGLGALSAYALYGEKGLANYLEGKDASGSGEDNNFLLNPSYWNKVDQYNTFDPNAIAKADINGGVSRWNNVVQPGTEGDFWTWNTANEALRMSKFAWSDLLKNYGLGKIVRGATRLAGGVELAPGVLASESGMTSKVINKAGAYGIMGTSSLGIDVAYGMQTYDEILRENNQKLGEIIAKDTEEEVKKRLTSPEAIDAFKQYVASENAKREATARATEGARWIAVDEEKAWDAYVEHIRRQVLEEQETLHAQDREQAKADAAHGYVLDATIEAVRMAPTNAMFKSYLFDKGTLNAINANNPYVNTTFKNGAYAVGKHAIRNKAMGQVANQIWGGFQSNYFDDVTVGFAKAFGIQDYNNYLLQKYNPAAYGTILDDYVAPIVAGMAGVRDAMVDKRSFIDGGVGALGAPFSFSYNLAGHISHSQRMKELAESIDKIEKEGGKASGIHWSEIASDFINNPILQAVADAHAATRLTEREILRANNILKENGYSLDNIVETATALNQVATAREGTSIMEAEDAKDKQAFTLVNALLDLRSNGAVMNAQAEPDKSSWSAKKKVSKTITDGINAILGTTFFDTPETSYTRAMQTLQDASSIDKNSSDEETVARQNELIKTFLGLDANKSAVENMSQQEKVDFARTRLKKNADRLLTMMEKTEKIQEKFSKSIGAATNPDVAKQLMFQYVLDDRWRERLGDIEELISGKREWESSAQENPVAKYGSVQGFEKALKAAEKDATDARHESWRAEEQTEKGNDPTKSILENARVKAQRLAQKQRADEVLKKKEAVLAEMKANAEAIKQALSDANVIKAEGILTLNPDDRLRMLDEFYKNDYSEAQQKEIERAKTLLMQDNTPFNQAMERVRDAAILNHRIEDNMEVARTIMRNPHAANLMQQALVKNRQRAIINYFNDKVVAEALNNLIQDSEYALTEEKVRENAKNLSTGVLNGMYKILQKEIKRDSRTRIQGLSDMTVQNLLDGIKKALDERVEGIKNTVDMDSFLKKTKKLNHTEVRLREGTPEIDAETGQPTTNADGEVMVKYAEQVTTEREISKNDRILLNYALDYAAEKGLSVDNLAQEVTTDNFTKYVEERNHTTTVENRANTVSPEYMRSLMQDALNAFHSNKKNVTKATESKPVAAQPQSVATAPVETKGADQDDLRPDDVKASDDPLGIKKKAPAQEITETKENTDIQEAATTLNSHLLNDVTSLLGEVDKIQMPEQTKTKLKDIISSLLSSTAFKNIKALQNRILEEALITNQAEAPQIEVIASRIANLEITTSPKAAAVEESKGNNPLFPTPSTQITSLETRDLDALMNYATWKEYITNHNVVGFLQKFSEALAKEYQNWKDKQQQGPLHQSQVVFIYDPALASTIKGDIENNGGYYNPEISAPIIIAIEITNKNKTLIDDESQLISIKDKTDNKIHQYQMIGVMPASEVSTNDSKAMQDTALKMSALRNRVNWEDNEAHVLRYAPQNNTGKYNGSVIRTNIEKVSSYTEEDRIPHATEDTPKTNVQQLMEDNLMSPTESLIQTTDEEKQAYEEAKDKGSLLGLRNTSLYKKMRKAFIDRLVKGERKSQDPDDPNSKELDFRIQKGTNDTYPKIVLTKKVSDTLDKNTGRPIVELLKEVDNQGNNASDVVNANSRFKRLFNQLSKLKVPSGLFDANGIPANKATYNKVLTDFAESVKKAVENNLHVDDLSVKVEIVNKDVENPSTSDKLVNINAYSGGEILSTLTTLYNGQLSQEEYASFLKDLILDAEGNVRQGLNDSRYERVKWQVNYQDAETANDNSKSAVERSTARTNLEELYDDGVFEMQVTKLAYPSRSVQVSINPTMKSKLYTEAKAEPQKTGTTKVTEQHPVTDAESRTGLVDGNSGMRMEPPTVEEIFNSIPQKISDTIDKMLSDSKERKLTDDGKHYNILGQIWSRVTSIKYALEGMEQRFNPKNAWALPSSLLGNSIDEFARDVFNGVFENMSDEERQKAFEGYDNSTAKNYAESYQTLKEFSTRLLQKGQIIIATGNRENPGHITAKGLLNVTVKGKNGVENKQVRVAGTLDVLAIDAQGNLHIYDFKTHRGTFDATKAIEKGYDRQLSMYAKFLEEEYGLKVKDVNIIPIKVEYPVPSGMDNDEHAIQGAQKTYRQSRPGSNQLEIKDITADDSKFEQYTGANYQIEQEFELPRLSDDKLVASFDKMTDAEKEALVEAIQDQSETPAEEVTKIGEIVASQPIIETKEISEEEQDGWDVDGDTSFLEEESTESAKQESTEDVVNAINPTDENSFLARLKDLKNACGGKIIKP